MAGWRFDPERGLHPDEARRVWQAAQDMAAAGRAASRSGFRRARDGHLILFLFATGCRISEALGARMGDVMRRRGDLVEVRLLKMKAEKDAAGLPGSTVVAFDRHDGEDLWAWVEWLSERGGADDDPLFPVGQPGRTARAAKPPSRQAAWSAIRSVYAQCGISRGLGPHAIRHAVAVLTLKQSKSMRVTQARLRHNRMATTEVYGRVLDEDVLAAASAAREFWDADVDASR